MASAIPSLLVAYEGDTGLMGFTSTSQGFSQLTCNVTSNSITGNSTVNLSHHMLRLHRIAKLLGLEKPNIITAFELIKHNQLETLQWKAGYLRSKINMLEWEKRNSMYHFSNLRRMINEFEETLAQKRGEMAYLNRECRKLRQRFIDYNAHNLHPITQSEPDNNSSSTQIVPYNKE